MYVPSQIEKNSEIKSDVRKNYFKKRHIVKFLFQNPTRSKYFISSSDTL